jgi:hypothetical protein
MERMSVYKQQLAQNGQLIDEMRKIISEKEEIIERLLSKIESLEDGKVSESEKSDKKQQLNIISTTRSPTGFSNVRNFPIHRYQTA